MSATSIDYKLSGVPQHIKLTGQVVANIYLGKITNWNDPAIAKLNPGVELFRTEDHAVYPL